MDQRNVERLFAWLVLQVEAAYHDEIDMAMDCFVQESYTREELERFLEYVMERVLTRNMTASLIVWKASWTSCEQLCL